MAANKSTPRRWTEEDEQYLRDNYGKKNHAQLAHALGRTVAGVVPRITKLKLTRDKWWPPEEDQFLRDNQDHTWEWCAEKLRRTTIAVYNRVRRLGIQRKRLTPGEFKRARVLHQEGKTTTEIGKILGVTDECIRRWIAIWKLGINKRDENKRMATLKANLMGKYGVDSIAKAHRVIVRRLRKASFTVSVESLKKAIEHAEVNQCPR